MPESYIPFPDTLSSLAWQAANAACIGVVIGAVQCPLNKLLANHAKNGQLLPDGFKWGAVRSLYKSLVPNCAGSSARTVYINGARVETTDVCEPATIPRSIWSRSAYVMTVSLGDVAIRQIYENRIELADLNVISKGFHWYGPHNLLKLFTTGIGVRYSAAAVNFFALCIGEDALARVLPGGNHFLSGALCGAAAAVTTYPFNYWHQSVLKNTTVVDGRLQPPTPLSLIKDAYLRLQDRGGLPTAQEFMIGASRQLPVRMVKTAAVFGVVSGATEVFGPEPLARLRFFSQPHQLPESDEKFSPPPPLY